MSTSVSVTERGVPSRCASVRYQYAAPLSVQYDTCEPSASMPRGSRRVPARAVSRRAQRSRQSRASTPATTAISVLKPLGTEARSPCQPQRISDSAAGSPADAASSPGGTAMTCSWNWSSGASSSVPTSLTHSNGIITDGRNGQRVHPVNESSVAVGSANSMYW